MAGSGSNSLDAHILKRERIERIGLLASRTTVITTICANCCRHLTDGFCLVSQFLSDRRFLRQCDYLHHWVFRRACFCRSGEAPLAALRARLVALRTRYQFSWMGPILKHCEVHHELHQ
jgi:hypothetical protein